MIEVPHYTEKQFLDVPFGLPFRQAIKQTIYVRNGGRNTQDAALLRDTGCLGWRGGETTVANQERCGDPGSYRHDNGVEGAQR